MSAFLLKFSENERIFTKKILVPIMVRLGPLMVTHHGNPPEKKCPGLPAEQDERADLNNQHGGGDRQSGEEGMRENMGGRGLIMEINHGALFSEN